MFDRYDEVNKDSAGKEQSIAWHMLAKIRILNVVIQWLDTFYPDFYVSSEMVSNHVSYVNIRIGLNSNPKALSLCYICPMY